jgi:hypothetical protein
MLVSQTLELEDADLAVRDILAQLDLNRRIKRDSVALVFCNNAFMESGVARAVCERLPFPTVGMNTFLSSASGGLTDPMILTAGVLTSDTCRFAVGLSEPFPEIMTGVFDKLYVEVENLLDRRPAMGMVFSGFHPVLPLGELLADALDEASDGVPFFGSLAADYTLEVKKPRILFNGEHYPDRAALLLVDGPIEPRFTVQQVSLARSIPQKAIVTGAFGNTVMEINGMTALDFMESLGLCQDGLITGADAIPVLIDRVDGSTPVFRNIMAQTPENGIILSGAINEGALLGLGSLDMEHVLAGARELSTRAGHAPCPRPLLAISCISRNIVLGFSYGAEAEVLRTGLASSPPFTFAYSLGEICPVPSSAGRWRNAYHNMSLVAASV